MWRRFKAEWRASGIGVRLFVLLGGLLFSGLFVFLIVLLLNWNPPSPQVPSRPLVERVESEKTELYSSLEAIDALPRIGPNERSLLERHFLALGGVERLASINSLLATGEIAFEGGEIYRVVIAKKLGGHIRVALRTEERLIVMSVSPSDQWRAVYRDGRLGFLGDLSEAEADSLQRSSYVVSELYLAIMNAWTIKYLGEQAFNYQMCHCFEVKVNDRNRIRFFINPETYLDVGREDWVFSPSGELSITRYINYQFIDVNGFKIPSRMETYENNTLMQTFYSENLVVNPGILDTSFVRPEIPEPRTLTP